MIRRIVMEQKKTVLVIGRHEAMLARVTAELNALGYHALGSARNEEALQLGQAQHLDAVLIGGGVDAESRAIFQAAFPKWNPEVKVRDIHPHNYLQVLQSVLSPTQQ
jgi:precorrin-6B methylase 2